MPLDMTALEHRAKHASLESLLAATLISRGLHWGLGKSMVSLFSFCRFLNGFQQGCFPGELEEP